MDKDYLRGDMYYAELGEGIGSEQNGRRPVLIIQNNVGNKHGSTVIVAALTSEIESKAKLPVHYLIRAENGLQSDSLILFEQIRTIDKQRLENFIGHIYEKHFAKIDTAIAISLGLMDTVHPKTPICLCGSCSKRLFETGAFFLKKISVTDGEKCTYCKQRSGNIYEVSVKIIKEE